MASASDIVKSLWKDSVVSAVIAAAIIAAIGTVFKGGAFWRATTPIPNWVSSIAIGIIALLFFFAIARYRRGPKAGLTSDRWFDEIVRQVGDCTAARIYLRSFTHPDHFRSDHREALLKFMRSLKTKFESGADIKIVAYHYRRNEKSGLDWLKAELGSDFNAGQIKLIEKQPIANTSSIYLFDSGAFLYNERNAGDRSYYAHDVSSTVVYHLLRQGYEAVWNQSDAWSAQ